MQRIILLLSMPFMFAISCAQAPESSAKPSALTRDSEPYEIVESIINKAGNSLETRINTPSGFERTHEVSGSFASYLRQLSLKPHGTSVLHYNGTVKENRETYVAVVDLEIGDKDLHQCADAVMRLRAEYLWRQGKFDDIHFNFTNGFRVDYSEWIRGKRMVVHGNETYWVEKSTPSNTYPDFWNYMELIFTYAGTLSLSKEMQPVTLEEMKIGDVFIQGGSPGHAVIVVDMAENSETKEKVFMLAQSYMPAQETQILTNQNNDDLSPWYAISEIDDDLYTPEWRFSRADLKRFEK